ncbi:2,4-dienoyl-CoA reductase [Nakamurella panacisegetis]|uniref:2,4-dienoyl-CoA reductase n=1 Tax=Nakamurella panacisegetis TaxID=1090615 RepID=A0A1H0I5J8_9ACTN|nr:NADH:flavin oxidoreductase/NADH oxidase [Nakamurella panacisegetis]SDO26450.1 2,4-dienoyl-CoA reductase [Nakamurella panacisegetis]
MSLLFEPLTLRSVTFANRIFLAPMCQYSCQDQDGVPGDWHLVHLGSHAIGGFGLILTEASAVSPEGRISPQDAGIWNDVQTEAWTRINAFLHAQGTVTGIQLAHAGRKASTYSPFAGKSGSVPESDGGWTTVGPSALAFDGYAPPQAMSVEAIAKVVADFGAAARRADQAGFDVVEIHAAHGYLLHQFLSPLSNQRTDGYGGDFAGRSRLLSEVVTAVRASWPADKPVFVRFSGTDWTDGGWSLAETKLAAELVGRLGADFVDVSSGGNVAKADIPVGPGYQVPLAAAVRSATGLPTGAVGLITEPAQAERILTDGSADAVLLARAALREPGWPLRAAHELGLPTDKAPYRPQYERGAWR